MKLLLAYASTDGQTRKIARVATDWLADHGHTVELLPLAEGLDVKLGRFDAVLLAGSIHASSYQKSLTEFCATRCADLSNMPSLFLSVSLTAAGHDVDDWKALEHILSEFTDATGWTPGRVEQIAGAYRPSQYDIFRGFIMRRIMASKDPGLDLSEDREYTDWAALNKILADWTSGIDGNEAT